MPWQSLPSRLMQGDKQEDSNYPHQLEANMARYPYVSNYAFDPVSRGGLIPPATDYRRRTWYGSSTIPVTDYEVNNYLSSGTPKRSINNKLRGVSISPVYASHPSVPIWLPSSKVRRSSLERSKPSSSHSREALAPYEDVVVGVAHTSQYGDIVIGIPYHKRFMFNAEPYRQSVVPIKSSYRRASVAWPYTSPYDDIDYVLASKSNRSSSKAFLSPSLNASYYAPHKNVITMSESYRQSVMPIKSSYRRASVAWPYTSPYDDIDYVSTNTSNRSSRKALQSPSFNASYYGPGQNVIPMSDNEFDFFPNRPASTRTPLYGRSHSVGRKFEGVPEVHKDNYIGNQVPWSNRTSYVAPSIRSTSYAGQDAGGNCKLPPRAPKLPVSEARRKVRDLLCKSKNDPTYYEN